jgi:hypothetical protein
MVANNLTKYNNRSVHSTPRFNLFIKSGDASGSMIVGRKAGYRGHSRQSWVPTWVSNPGFAPNFCSQKIKNEIESRHVCFCFLCQRFSTKPSFPNPASNPGNVFCLSHHISIQTKSRGRAGFRPGFQNLGFHQTFAHKKSKTNSNPIMFVFVFPCQRLRPNPAFQTQLQTQGQARHEKRGKRPSIV